MDREAIKKALDNFENDEFTNAKEILQKEIKAAKFDFLKKKLDLANDIEPKPSAEKESDNEE
jgi:hypothetical protein